MYRIRFHGRGGQGMKTASRILGTAFFLEGFEVQDAPRYGAERRGAPIFAYVRASREPIKERGIIRHPQLVLVADDSLISIPAAGVLEGINEKTTLLIRTYESSETWRDRLNLPGRVLTLSSPEMMEKSDLLFIGAFCAGAAARLTGEISPEVLVQAIEFEISHLGPTILQKNIDMTMAAFELLSAHANSIGSDGKIPASDFEDPEWVDLPLEAAWCSAPAIHAPATSVQVKTGLWRTMRPVIDSKRCNRCWWVCSTFCPDSAIEVGKNGLPRIDYDHCKGCMICVAQCPPHAIEAVSEHVPESLAAQGAHP